MVLGLWELDVMSTHHLTTHYHSSSIIALSKMSPQDTLGFMVVVPWTPLIVIDVEVNVPFVFTP